MTVNRKYSKHKYCRQLINSFKHSENMEQRCWWRNMLQNICVGDNFKMLVTVLTISVTIIYYLFTFESGANIQKMSPASKFSHPHRQMGTNFKSPTSRCHQHHCHQRWLWCLSKLYQCALMNETLFDINLSLFEFW